MIYAIKLCFLFLASPIMEINVASNNQRDNGCTTISVVQQDCTVHVLVLQSLEPNSSFLEQLVHADEGMWHVHIVQIYCHVNPPN